MSIPTDDPRRRLLAVVPYSRLAEWGRDAGIDPPPPGGAAALVEALLAARRFPATARRVLERMSPHELDLACRDLGGIGGSLDRARLEERILAIVAPSAPPGDSPATADAMPRIPVGAWLEGKRRRASIAAEREHRARRLLESTWFRAGSWGLLFLALAWLMVFFHTVDALLLGLGVGALAFTVYRIELAVPFAMLLAASEIAVRFLVFGVGGASPFSLVCIVFAELLCAAVMSIDARSASTSEITLGLREHLGAGRPRAGQKTAAADGEPEVDPPGTIPPATADGPAASTASTASPESEGAPAARADRRVVRR